MANYKRRDNHRALQEAEPRFYDYLDGTTGKLDPDTGIPLSNASQGLTAGWTWVQLEGQREGAAVLNSTVNPYSPGIPVETAIDRKTNKRFITSIHWEEAVRIFGEDTARRMATPTPQAVESDALTIGKVEPGPGLTIYVRRFVHDLTEFPGAYYDLTSIISGMSADSQEIVIVGVDETTNAITVTEGAEKSLAYTFQQADADAIALATGVVPLAALVLRDDQTDSTDSFVPYKRFFDRRQFLNIASGAGYVVLDPGSDTRNVIQPTGDFIGLVIKNNASQTVAPFQHHTSAGAVDASITAAGGLTGTSLSILSTVGGTLVNVIADGGGANLISESYNAVNPSTSTQFTFSRARGSLSAKSAITTNDRMGQILFQGYDGDQMSNSVTIIASVSDTVADNSVPGRLIFNLLSLAGDTVVTEYLRFQGGVIVFNEGGADLDIRIEGDGNANLFFTDGGNDRIGMFTNAPSFDVSLGGNAARTLAMNRHTTSNNAGNSLTLQAGGATSAATNKVGGALILAPGLGTGNAIPGITRIQGDAPSATSSTTDHTQVDRLTLGNVKVLTDNSAITIVNATLASGSAIGGIIRYCIEVTDGTDYQVETGFAVYTGVNKAGAFTVSITEVNSQQSVSAGTLTTAWAISGANPAAVSVNANSSLTPSTGFPRICYSIENFSPQAIAAA